MISIMSYQYQPPQEGPEAGMSQVAYMGSHLSPTTSTVEGDPMSPTRRREPLSKEYKLKRTVSTPNVRPQGTHEADHEPLGLPNEKRRNKLGYHRTPIACIHCRRRKIRCKQPETPDVRGRCESCINLGRECHYSAVNQLPPPTTGQRQGSRASVGAGLSSPTTSPAMSKGHIVEAQSNAAYHQLGTAPSMASMGHQSMESEEDETYSAEPRIPPSAPTGRSYSYGHGSSGWISPEAANGAARASADPNTSWSNFAQGVPETSDISPYTSHAPAVSMSAWSTNVVGLSRIDTSDAWKSYPQGTRSMSYSDDQSGQYVSPTTRPYDDVQASIGSHVMPETSPDAHGTLSAGAAPHMAAYGAWPQSYQYAKPNEDYGGWYEDREHQLGAHVSPTGADPSQHGGMYYGGR